MNARFAIQARMLIGIAGFAAAVGLAGCDDSREPNQTSAAETPTDADVRREVGEAADAVGGFTEEKRDAFVDAAEKQYEALKEELAKISAEAEAKGAATQQRFVGMREALEREVRVAKERLDAADNASAAAWQEVKDGFTVALEDAKAALARARVDLFGPPAATPPPPPPH